ncbi:MAG TPA: AAA family ATPase [Solirubrobacterales bacterium]|nr:AAA family ATPase [Solirubrobacterales bacterium]
MSESEAVLVDIVRLVARGQADDVARRVSKLLRGVGGRRTHQLSKPCREALTKAVENAAAPASLRAAAGDMQSSGSLIDPRMLEIPAVVMAPVLSERQEEGLARIIAEHENAKRLLDHGVSPTRSLLLSGPPGVGKTMAATYIASRLNLPMHRAEPSTIVTSLLGESARNLASAFDAARREPSVLLLDEFDAFAKRRDDSHEVGELKRFVTTLLGELERGMPHGILIAATNHPELLDPAVYRRFDASMELGFPNLDARRRILNTALASRSISIRNATIDLFAAATEGASGSDLQRIFNEALRSNLLDDEDLNFALVRTAVQLGKGSRDIRIEVAQMARNVGLSTRETAELLGCSHTTVQRMYKGE